MATPNSNSDMEEYKIQKRVYKRELKRMFPTLDELMLNTVVDHCMEHPEQSPDDIVRDSPNPANFLSTKDENQERPKDQNYEVRYTKTTEEQRDLEEKAEKEEEEQEEEVETDHVHSAGVSERTPIREEGSCGGSGASTPER